MYYVYVLKSELKNQIYVGSTNDLKRRLEEHNNGKVVSTKKYLPWRLIYYEAFEKEKFARDREMKLKQNGNAMKELKKRIGLDLSSTSSKIIKTGAGFTLIELLVVIGIIGVLIGSLVLLINPVAQMQKARDSKLKSNVAQIQTALELYRSDCGDYPANYTSLSSPSNCTGTNITYIQTLPTFQSVNNIRYSNPGGVRFYLIEACVERDDTSLSEDATNCTGTSHHKEYSVSNP